MSDLGPLNYFLGIFVSCTPSYMLLSLQKYAHEILERAGMRTCKHVATPVDTNAKLSAVSGPPMADPTQYRSLTGALQYLIFTRPDIAYAVQHVCLFMHDPREPHLYALKHILCYIQGTIDHELHLYPTSTLRLITYTDVDWGDNLISWSSKRQPTLSGSSAEAEYRGVTNVIREQPRPTSAHQTCGYGHPFCSRESGVGSGMDVARSFAVLVCKYFH
ncbi:uncharacterized mitochondrial protein AtMg00810-like [Spinacia oleracea]|uniref:Uncharacterized mitochondrial protein AtMg00810-like n=1 Tax=Spinacia oleracea TaxID=3562 RepID=A0A9R0IDS5_SPIOL|nr:uncharacterized mitochondrial protein AtMg00810-like [Spinacia oleracea]